MDYYQVPAAEACGEMIVKGSRFIASIHRASDITRAEAIIMNIRQEHPRASHTCWAYIAGPPDTTTKGMSDDGEPKGTAGRPMLALLEGSGIGETVGTVTRYFGGIKLGTGGLMRAYTSTLKETLSSVQLKSIEQMSQTFLTFPYPYCKAIEQYLETHHCTIDVRSFATDIVFEVSIPKRKEQDLLYQLKQISKGQILIQTK